MCHFSRPKALHTNIPQYIPHNHSHIICHMKDEQCTSSLVDQQCKISAKKCSVPSSAQQTQNQSVKCSFSWRFVCFLFWFPVCCKKGTQNNYKRHNLTTDRFKTSWNRIQRSTERHTKKSETLNSYKQKQKAQNNHKKAQYRNVMPSHRTFFLFMELVYSRNT